MKTELPLFSVIIPTFNRAEMVCKCVQSVLDTKWPNLEIIVVDDCSPDDTEMKIKEIFGEKVKYVKNNKNSLAAVSKNNGAKVATGDYLFFLDDDNIIGENAIADIAQEFESNPKLGLVAPMAVHNRPGKQNIIWSLGSDFNHWTSQPNDNCPNLPLCDLPKDRKTYPTKDYPNAFAHFANEISLPLHTCLKDEEVEYVSSCFAEIIREYKR